MNRKRIFRIEYFVYLFVLLIPIFDFIFNEYIKRGSYDLLIQLSAIKLVIPLVLYIALLFITKRKEKIQFILVTLFYISISGISIYLTSRQYLANKISIEEYFKVLNDFFNLTIFILNFLIIYKIFFRKNTTRLRMSYNYAAAIYLIAVLLLSLTSESRVIWQIKLPVTLLSLIFISLVSLRYREDRTYSLLIFVTLASYYISTIRDKTGYYAVLMLTIIYLVSLVVEKYVKNKLKLSDINDIVKTNINTIINYIRSLNRTKIKRLRSGVFTENKRITKYSDKRIFKYNDFNRKKVYKSNINIKDELSRNEAINSEEYKKLEENKAYSGTDQVRKRLKEKKKQKKLEKLDKFLNTFFVRAFSAAILIFIAISIIYVILNYARVNFSLNFNIFSIYSLFYIPFIYVILRAVIFIVKDLKNIDSEFIMLCLLVSYIFVLSLSSSEIELDFSSGIIISTVLVVILNKMHIGNTIRDIEQLKEQIEYKENLVAKRRVVFGISSLSIGGVSRILVDICNSLSKKHPNLDIEIFTLFAGGEFENDVAVKVKSLFKKPYNAYSDFMKFIISIYLNIFEPNIFNKKIRGNYDTIIAFDEGDITSLFSYSDEAKKIAWIHNKNYNIYSKENKKYLRRTSKIYSQYDEIIFTREVGLRRFNKVFKNKKIKRIPKDIITNYVDPLRIFIKSEEEPVVEWTNKDRVLLSVVRLYRHKAIDRFIKVHKRILNDGINHKVYIIGDGPEYENLKKIIRQEKMQKSVFLLGTKINPYPYIREAEYFCLFSEKEEYSIVLNEAKILNKDILLTDTMTKDIVQDYPNARIFDNSESGMYTGLRYVLTKKEGHKTNFEYIYKNEDILRRIYLILN